jgi:hypothetical protein
MELWKGVEAYNVFKKQIFKLRVAYLWWKGHLLRLLLHWLPKKHPFRYDKKNFIKNTMVTKGPPKHLNVAEIYAQLNNLVLNEKVDKY